jgi:hypothetical protein
LRRLDARDAAPLSARSVAILTEAMTKKHDPTEPSEPFWGLVALAGWLEPKDATRAVGFLSEAIAKAAFRMDREDLARGLAALAGRLESSSSPFTALIGAMARSESSFLEIPGQLEPREEKSDAGVNGKGQGIPGLWEEVFRAFLTSPQPSRRAIMASTAVACLGDGPGGSLALLILAVEPAPCRFSTSELVEMLKEPLCIGPARGAVLDQLEIRYQQKFADQWDFVRYARKQNLEEREDFVLAGPPTRLATADELADLESGRGGLHGFRQRGSPIPAPR